MPQLKRAFVVGMVRRLRQFGPLARRGRIPRQQQPDALRLEYYKALLPAVHAATAAFAEVRAQVLHLLASELRAAGRLDSPSEDDAKRLVREAKERAERQTSEEWIASTAKRFGARVSTFQREQLDKQTRAALGIPLALIEPATVSKLEAFANENVKLITSVSSRYFDRIQSDVEEAFAKGTHPSTLAETFMERDGMAERDARRIARDQIGKLNAEFNEERQRSLGIVGYTWRTSNDERVRDEHAERDGKAYTWADPPEDGNPGEPIQCRCYAEPDFGPILDGL